MGSWTGAVAYGIPHHLLLLLLLHVHLLHFLPSAPPPPQGSVSSSPWWRRGAASSPFRLLRIGEGGLLRNGKGGLLRIEEFQKGAFGWGLSEAKGLYGQLMYVCFAQVRT